MNKPFKNSLIIFSLFSILSCGEKSSDSEASSSLEIAYEIDTVQVNSKGYFFYLSEALGRSFLSKDGKTLYNLNQKKPMLEVVDLTTLVLKDTIPLEREGPSGIGNSPFFDGFQVLESGEIFIFAWEELVKLNADRNKVEKYRFDQLKLKGDTLLPDEVIRYEGLISEDGQYLFTYYGSKSDIHSRLGLVRIGLEDLTIKKLDLPIFEELLPFEIKSESSNGYPYTYVEPIHLTQRENQLLVSSSPFNEAYRIDQDFTGFERHTFTSLITADRAEITYPTNHSSEAKQTNAIRDRSKQVSFYGLNWDAQSHKFWRLTNQTFMENETNPNKTTLTFFNRELNQLGEVSLPEDWKIRGAPLIAQGLYWQFINIDDEMAFVRFKPTISKK
jgi:hypothetical protein